MGIYLTLGCVVTLRFLHADSADSDQTRWMPRLIYIFSGCIGHFANFDMQQLLNDCVNSITHINWHDKLVIVLLNDIIW